MILRRPSDVVCRRADRAHGWIDTLRVVRAPVDATRGRLIAGGLTLPCALGPAGITHCKREGDGATPAGRFRMLRVLVRPDRVGRPRAALPLRHLAPSDGWCDDAGSACYNRPVRRPFAGSHEALWRDDPLYDCVVVIAYNTGPIRKARGSAIFLHVARPGLLPTAGCVALPRAVLLRLLPRLGPRTRIVIA